MSAPTVPATGRAPNGHFLPGSVHNPGGRPRTEIERVRELLGQHRDEFVATLLELVRSPDEKTKLAALEIAFDRMLGRPPVAVDQTVQKFDHTAAYLAALQAVNAPTLDLTPTDTAPDEW
jgi:hypothetical protein